MKHRILFLLALAVVSATKIAGAQAPGPNEYCLMEDLGGRNLKGEDARVWRVDWKSIGTILPSSDAPPSGAINQWDWIRMFDGVLQTWGRQSRVASVSRVQGTSGQACGPQTLVPGQHCLWAANDAEDIHCFDLGTAAAHATCNSFDVCTITLCTQNVYPWANWGRYLASHRGVLAHEFGHTLALQHTHKDTPVQQCLASREDCDAGSSAGTNSGPCSGETMCQSACTQMLKGNSWIPSSGQTMNGDQIGARKNYGNNSSDAEWRRGYRQTFSVSGTGQVSDLSFHRQGRVTSNPIRIDCAEQANATKACAAVRTLSYAGGDKIQLISLDNPTVDGNWQDWGTRVSAVVSFVYQPDVAVRSDGQRAWAVFADHNQDQGLAMWEVSLTGSIISVADHSQLRKTGFSPRIEYAEATDTVIVAYSDRTRWGQLRFFAVDPDAPQTVEANESEFVAALPISNTDASGVGEVTAPLGGFDFACRRDPGDVTRDECVIVAPMTDSTEVNGGDYTNAGDGKTWALGFTLERQIDGSITIDTLGGGWRPSGYYDVNAVTGVGWSATSLVVSQSRRVKTYNTNNKDTNSLISTHANFNGFTNHLDAVLFRGDADPCNDRVSNTGDLFGTYTPFGGQDISWCQACFNGAGSWEGFTWGSRDDDVGFCH